MESEDWCLTERVNIKIQVADWSGTYLKLLCLVLRRNNVFCYLGGFRVRVEDIIA